MGWVRMEPDSGDSGTNDKVIMVSNSLTLVSGGKAEVDIADILSRYPTAGISNFIVFASGIENVSVTLTNKYSVRASYNGLPALTRSLDVTNNLLTIRSSSGYAPALGTSYKTSSSTTSYSTSTYTRPTITLTVMFIPPSIMPE